MQTKLTRAEIKDRIYRRRYLLPNGVTVANLFCGFLAIIYASSGRIEKACIAIGFAILLDGLDGRVARRFNATSKFGIEFDSFSDLISFGVAPAILMYNWCFKVGADEFGVFINFIYVVCAASRLARFNIADENLKNFIGLPTPGAASVVAASVNFSSSATFSTLLSGYGTFIMAALSYLMVSKVEYFSLKQFKIGRTKLWVRLGMAALIGLTWYNTEFGFLVIAVGYAVSGPAGVFRRKRLGLGFQKDTENTEKRMHL